MSSLRAGAANDLFTLFLSGGGEGGAGVDPRIAAEGVGGLQPVFPSASSELATHFTAGPSETFAE